MRRKREIALASPLPRQGLHQFLKHLEESLDRLRITLSEAFDDPFIKLLRARRDDKFSAPKQRMLIEDRSSSIVVVQGKSRAHRLMKERALLRFELMKHLGVRAVFLSATKIAETFPTLEEAYRVVLEEHAIN